MENKTFNSVDKSKEAIMQKAQLGISCEVSYQLIISLITHTTSLKVNTLSIRHITYPIGKQ